MARRGAGRIYSSVNSQSSQEGFGDDIVLDDFQPRQLSIALLCLGLTFPVPDLHCHVYPLASSWLPFRSFDGLPTRAVARSLLSSGLVLSPAGLARGLTS